MDNFKGYMNGKYDLIHSSYAIYYSAKPKILLNQCYKSLEKDGKLILTVPCFPHTLVELANSINNVPLNVIQSLDFYKQIITPFIKKKFSKIKIHRFKNLLKISDKKDFEKIYKATTYYNKKSELKIMNKFQHSVKKYGYFKIEKNAKMIICTK